MTAAVTLLRSFEVDDVNVNGRTLEVRCVPYGVVAIVRDRLPNGEMTRPYREGWDRGAFRHVTRAANRVPLVVGRHERRADPFADVGRATAFDERDDGLIGRFAVDESPFGDHALAKVTSGQWRGVSIGAAPRRHRDDGDPHGAGVRWRTLAHLDHVLLTEHPAYEGAEVLAVREDPPTRLEEWLAKYPLAARR